MSCDDQLAVSATPAKELRHDATGHWLREAGQVAPAPGPKEDRRADVIVVGGGYAGLWTAWTLLTREPGLRVVVIEAGVCGAGPSGRNGGFINGFWHKADLLCELYGDRGALGICAEAARSVDAIGAWARSREREVGFRKGGHLKVSTSAAQDEAWAPAVHACERLGAAQEYRPVGAADVQARCASPLFRGGALMPQAAIVQPALLARELRAALGEAGATIHERTRARRIAPRRGCGVAVEVDSGIRLHARDVVLAIGPATAGFRPLRSRLAVSSTHMVVTEPVPDVLEELGWSGQECISTARRYLNYFRTTTDHRIAFGWGGGRLAYGARLGGRVEIDRQAAERLRRDIVSFFPGLRGRRITAAWGGPVDVSPTHVPAIGTLAGGRVHYVCGFTGNGVGPSHLAGRILAASALDERSELTRLALVEPRQPPVPPEPLRWLGGSLVRAALLRKEDREDRGRSAHPLVEFVADMPRRLGIHVGR